MTKLTNTLEATIAAIALFTAAGSVAIAQPQHPKLQSDQSRTFYVPGTDTPVDPPKGNSIALRFSNDPSQFLVPGRPLVTTR
jgi:hypothetical protein